MNWILLTGPKRKSKHLVSSDMPFGMDRKRPVQVSCIASFIDMDSKNHRAMEYNSVVLIDGKEEYFLETAKEIVWLIKTATEFPELLENHPEPEAESSDMA